MAWSQQTLRLSGGPCNGQVFYVEDREERRRAADGGPGPYHPKRDLAVPVPLDSREFVATTRM
jgi:hypothetical protein